MCVCIYIYIHTPYIWGFPDSSVGKESACNAGDPCSIPGSRRSAWEGIGNPLQYSWATLVAQLVKNPPAMQETWVGSLGWEDPLEKGKATYLSILPWRIPWTVQSMGLQSQTRQSDCHFHVLIASKCMEQIHILSLKSLCHCLLTVPVDSHQFQSTEG